MTKPFVYVSSPYTKGDVGINVRFQCQIFDQLMNDGVVWPTVPLWSHAQHLTFPRPYQDWMAYDLAIIPRHDACLRLDVSYPELAYFQHDSSGADKEVAFFLELGKPVFYSIEECYEWAKTAFKEGSDGDRVHTDALAD